MDTQRHRSAPHPQRRPCAPFGELRRQRAERRNVQGQVNFKLDSGEKSGKIIAELEHASFAYGDKVIMDKFSAILQRGDKIGLIGPNGIGKTTFLKLILGELQRPTAESVSAVNRKLLISTSSAAR